MLGGGIYQGSRALLQSHLLKTLTFDWLRMVNRAHGYDMGNAIVARVAHILVNAVGTSGVVVRPGGTFTRVLPHPGGAVQYPGIHL